jgi:hypothetical protein
MDEAMIPQEWDRCFSAIWTELGRSLDLSGAATAILMDPSGNAVTYAGEDPEFDLSTFASLAVADFLAQRELAGVLGDRDLQWVVHQGAKSGLVLLPLHPLLILGVLFDPRTTLGLVRHQLRKDRERLVEATRPLVSLLQTQLESDLEESARIERLADGDAIGESLERLFGPAA